MNRNASSQWAWKGHGFAFPIRTQVCVVKKKTNEHESFVMCSQQEAEMGHNQRTLREASGNVKLCRGCHLCCPLNTFDISLNIISVPAWARTGLHFWALKFEAFQIGKELTRGLPAGTVCLGCMCPNVHPFCMNGTVWNDFWAVHSMWETLVLIMWTHFSFKQVQLMIKIK